VLSGKVGSSLNRAARKAGLTAANINALTDDIFKYDIDFDSDLSPNDRFSVVVEQTWREGQLVATGPVQARPSPSMASCIRGSASPGRAGGRNTSPPPASH